MLLDTCTTLWLMARAPLHQAALHLISAAQRHDAVQVSAIVAWEIATLVRKGRLVLSEEPLVWFQRVVALPGIRLADLNPGVLVASAELPGTPPKDPADRIQIATATSSGLTLITRDREIIRYAQSGQFTAMEC